MSLMSYARNKAFWLLDAVKGSPVKEVPIINSSMNILYVTTIGSTMSFFKSYIEELMQNGHKVDIACNNTVSPVSDFYKELGCEIHTIQTSRSPLNIGNFIAIKQIRQLITKNNYDIVHCHTPIAAMCTRLACRSARKRGTKVIYTAHGFHFYKGAPVKNWLIYYPIEKFCAHFTDVLITINQEDYALAQKKMKAKKIVYVPGVGIDLSKYSNLLVDKSVKREELGIPKGAVVLLSIGELNENKNHETVIRAIETMPNVYYMIAGKGGLQKHLQTIITQQNLTKRVKLLGFRNDIRELCAVADVYVMPSYREGLSVSLMEAMASGLPCVVSKIRGNTDLIDENGGEQFDPYNIEDCRKAISRLLAKNIASRGKYNKEKIKSFSVETVNKKMIDIYFGMEK